MINHIFKALVVVIVAKLILGDTLDNYSMLYIALSVLVGFLLVDCVKPYLKSNTDGFYGYETNRYTPYYHPFYTNNYQSQRFDRLNRNKRYLQRTYNDLTHKMIGTGCSDCSAIKIANLQNQRCNTQKLYNKVSAKEDRVAKRTYGPYGAWGSNEYRGW